VSDYEDNFKFMIWVVFGFGIAVGSLIVAMIIHLLK
jgi:hypothetical protein